MHRPLPKVDRDICAINKGAILEFSKMPVRAEGCQSLPTASAEICLHSYGAFFDVFRFIFVYVSCVYAHECRCPRKPKEGIEFHAAGVTGSPEPPRGC